MATDLRPYVGEFAGQGQTTMSEGAADRWYNCTLECLRRTAIDLKFPEPYDDEQFRNVIRAQYGSTGLPWSAGVQVAQALIPGLAPLMSIQNPADPVVTLQAAMANGHIAHIGLWCDVNAWVPAQGPVTYSHCCRVVGDDGTKFFLQNPEPHPDFTLTYPQVRSLYDGGDVLVFEKSVLPAAVAAAPAAPPRRLINNNNQAGA